MDVEKLQDSEIKKISEELLKKLQEYNQLMKYMSADAPIQILCLPSFTEKALLDHGCNRIYDLFDLDFTKVKGLGAKRIGDLTACLNQFFSMS